MLDTWVEYDQDESKPVIYLLRICFAVCVAQVLVRVDYYWHSRYDTPHDGTSRYMLKGQ